MPPVPDSALLQEFARSHSYPAFRALVDRHLDHVHSVAQRVLHNHALAANVRVLGNLATSNPEAASTIAMHPILR
ncbi:MAG: hypothetical protein ACI9R3_006113 [Verrucomicrobiales bacterium]|jgi:hypothetical protein